MGKIPYNFQKNRNLYHLNRGIHCIDILKNDVYIEYTDRESEYISFTKAKKIVFELSPSSFTYSCVDSTKSVDFLNSLLTRYIIHDNRLILKN